MGLTSKAVSVILRIGELSCSVIVLGLVSSFLYRVGDANVYADSRLIFTIVLASISTAFSILLMLPFLLSFMAFLIDFILFATWLTAFCLNETLTGIHTCNAVWYWSYWGYYWGGFWRRPIVVTGPVDIGWSGCASWRTVLAFSFIASMIYLLSSILGLYVVMKHREEKQRMRKGNRYDMELVGGKSRGGHGHHEHHGVSDGLSSNLGAVPNLPAETSTHP